MDRFDCIILLENNLIKLRYWVRVHIFNRPISEVAHKGLKGEIDTRLLTKNGRIQIAKDHTLIR